MVGDVTIIGRLLARDYARPFLLSQPCSFIIGGRQMLSKSGRLVATLILVAWGAVLVGPISAQDNPVPFISQPLVPDAVAPGGAGFTLTVNGTGFVSGAVVYWNGSARATAFVSSTKLTASILASDIALAGTASVTVVNSVTGGVTSNVAFLPVAVSTPTVGFSLASAPVTGEFSTSSTVADFNRDGKQDLAVANGSVPGMASILMGEGNGNFNFGPTYTVEDTPSSIAVGDFNGDSYLDMAVADACGATGNCGGPGTVSILLGDGTGNFTLAYTITVGSYPGAISTADFNGDGNLDLATANQFDDTVSILLGDGTGNFTLVSSPAAGVYPESVAVGDFNGDGKLDLAVANYTDSGTVSILLGDGTGNFTLTSSFATGSYSLSAAVSDFNGDGKLDLAVNNFCGTESPDCNTAGTVSILLGDGTGNFTLASSPGTGDGPWAITVADFNADGKPDLAVVNQGSATVSVLLGDGTGNFTLAASPATGMLPRGVAVGDFNGDGKLDLAATNFFGDSVSILVQAPAVTLVPSSLSFGDQPVSTTSAPQTVTLTNSGSATLAISGITITGTGSSDFAETNTCGTSVAVGASCTISVTFTPMVAGSLTAAVTITDNGSGSPQAISLSGTGASAVVNLSPSSLTFGSQLLGTTSAAQNVTLTNTGNATLTITSIAASGDFAETNTCGSSVAAGANCTISVTFTPEGIGTLTGAVAITDNAYGSPHQTVTLTGTGTEVEFTPASLSFPVQVMGTSSAAMNVTLTNVGSTALTLTGFNITGTDAEDFSQTNTCGGNVGAGLSCTISVVFKPTERGPRTASVSVMDNGGGGTQSFAVSGIGTVVSLSAQSLNFGSVMVGMVSSPRTVILTNVGTRTLSITSIGVVGLEKGDFLATNSCGKSVPAGGTCSVIVRFVPTEDGLRTADIKIIDNGGGSPQAIRLIGTGT
jgi:hypothetical protein